MAADPTIADLISSGGVVAFAGLVYWEVRRIRDSIGRIADRVARLEERHRLDTPPIGIPIRHGTDA